MRRNLSCSCFYLQFCCTDGGHQVAHAEGRRLIRVQLSLFILISSFKHQLGFVQERKIKSFLKPVVLSHVYGKFPLFCVLFSR